MILFVCSGNTCRSPMAETLYNKLTGGQNSISAGLNVGFHSGATQYAMEAVEKYGADLSFHVSRPLTANLLAQCSPIITMTRYQKEYLEKISQKPVITLAEFAGKSYDIMDPYGGSQEIYDKCAEEIYFCIKEGLMRKRVRAARACDTEKILELEKKSFTDSWNEKIVLECVRKNEAIVYERNGSVYGYCLFLKTIEEGEILRIAVDDVARRKGIGMAMLNYVFSIMLNENIRTVYLEVRESNSAAIELYKAAGFKQAGVRKNYYSDTNEDALIFNLNLKER